MEKITLFAPAKLNLHLRLCGRRPDGFHDLESVFAALDFGDTLRVELLPETETLEIAMEFQGANVLVEAVPPEKNIVFKAVFRFRERTGFRRGLRVRIVKRIPLGGGLGGGSSDAAAALLALNSLAGPRGLDKAALAELGAALGSDVPFFLAKTAAAWVTGRGERIQGLPSPSENCCFVLVNPGFSSNTAAAFRLFDEYRLPSASPPVSPETAIRALAGKARNWPFFNDFLPVFQNHAGENAQYQRIIGQLQEAGADFAGLSGSGSTCFGVFTGAEAAKTAEKKLAADWPFVTTAGLLCGESGRGAA